jgi:hypothetical protein
MAVAVLIIYETLILKRKLSLIWMVLKNCLKTILTNRSTLIKLQWWTSRMLGSVHEDAILVFWNLCKIHQQIYVQNAWHHELGPYCVQSSFNCCRCSIMEYLNTWEYAKPMFTFITMGCVVSRMSVEVDYISATVPCQNQDFHELFAC